MKRIRGKKHPLTAASLQALRDEHTRAIEPTQRRSGPVVGVQSHPEAVDSNLQTLDEPAGPDGADILTPFQPPVGSGQ